MGKTSDLAMVQKMIIDTLHKEGKSQSVIYIYILITYTHTYIFGINPK